MLIRPLIQPLLSRRDSFLGSQRLVRSVPRLDDGIPVRVTIGALGTASGGTTPLSLAQPASIAAGDYLLMAVANKYPPAAPGTPTGYTPLAQMQGGVGAAGADAGEVFITLFSRIADGLESGNVAVTVTDANVSSGQIVRFVKPAGTTWDVAVAKGADNTAGTIWDVLMDADVDIRAGDVLMGVSAINSDVATAWTGVNGPVWVIPGIATAGLGTGLTSFSHVNATGDDLYLRGDFRQILQGKSMGVARYGPTPNTSLANAPAGATILVRLRAV